MRLRQEKVVFVVALLVLGLLGWRLTSSGPTQLRGRTRSQAAEFEPHAPPPVDVALPLEDTRPPLSRELFAPPRDTRPLAPLVLIEPPREPLPTLLPPTDPGPAPHVYGRLLRTPVALDEAPELFADLGELPGTETDLSFLEEEEESEPDAIALLRELGEEEDPGPFADESPAERYARIEGYKDRYDWIVPFAGAQPVFGRIENEDRYALGLDPDRAEESIRFTQIDPETGRAVFENIGDSSIVHQRGDVDEFHFARTVTNEVELRSREIGERLTRGTYEDALNLAAFAVRSRLEAPRALAIAERLYKLCAAFDPEDPEPRMGLAGCYEAGFEFERAFQEYRALVEAFPHRPAIHVRLAELEARFLMREQALARLREALVVDRGSWEARWALGRHLAADGAYEEALQHLEQAARVAPQDPELLHVRVGIRTDLGATLLADGKLAEARRWFDQALSADPAHQGALAGRLATVVYGGGAGGELNGSELNSGAPDAGSDEEGAGFKLALARGVAALAAGDHRAARDRLLAAREADPLHADRALAALSFLAERTGHPEEALRFADEAIEVNPENAYALYQRGRLLGAVDDYQGAREALLAALEVDLDFEDALVALGDMAFRLGRFEDAERYLERAVGLDAGRNEVHALRGLNLLLLGSVGAARNAFEAALELSPEDPIGRAGLAWCTYLEGDSTEAMILLADLDDSRRDQPEEDGWRVWARQQLERIRDHEEKVVWSDGFNRKRLINSWLTREGDGVQVGMEDGAVKVSGVFTAARRATVHREYPSSVFVSIEADFWFPDDQANNFRAGLFVARERQRRNSEPEITSEASVSRHREGGVQVRLVRSGRQPEMVDMQQPFPTGRWVRLGIVRRGETSRTTVTLTLDGVPLIEDVSLAALGSGATSPVVVGLFVEGEQGREVLVKMDDVDVVYRTR